MVEIVSLREKRPSYAFDVVVDRTTPLGNPYRMRREEDRWCVCELYDVYFHAVLEGDSRIPAEERDAILKALDDVARIYDAYGKVRLFCWCYPKRCHAETIRRFLLSRKK